MTDDIRMGTNASLMVAEAASADDGTILGVADADGDTDGEDERANRSLAAYAQETDQ